MSGHSNLRGIAYSFKKIRAARGKVWGSDDINVEGWKTLKRLSGHESGSSLELIAIVIYSFCKQM